MDELKPLIITFVVLFLVIGGLYLLFAAAIGTVAIASWIFTSIGMVLP